MQISNSFSDYSQEDLQAFREVVFEMNDFLEKTNKIFVEEVASTTPRTENVVYINPRIKVEFGQLEKAALPFHEVLAIYREWHEELFALAIKNVGNYKNIRVQTHVDQIMTICRTFGLLVKTMKA
jgi:hypothetical protein